MSDDTQPTPTPTATPTPTPTSTTPTIPPFRADERQVAFIVYILYLAHFVPVIGWVASIVGLVLAYVERDSAPAWLKSHYNFQIRTFWIGLLYYVVSLVLCIILIGIPLLMATFVWFVVRCALGLARLSRNEAYANPDTWLV